MSTWQPMRSVIDYDLKQLADVMPYSASLLCMYANQAVCFADAAILEAMADEE